MVAVINAWQTTAVANQTLLKMTTAVY